MIEPLHVEECDYQDPVAAYARLAREPFALLFDSALLDSRQGRHAFIVTDPFLTLVAKDSDIRIGERRLTGDPFEILRAQLARFPQRHRSDLPPFQGGVAGYFGYDLCHHLEKLPPPPAETNGVLFPDMALGFYDTVLAFDVVDRRSWIISTGQPETAAHARRRRAAERAEQLRKRLEMASPPLPQTPNEPTLSWESNFTREGYRASVAKVIDYIWAGDIFQANLSQRFLARLPAGFDTFGLYRRLRGINPAPFAAYLDFGEAVIASSSPERFLKVAGDQVETRPIKGTRPRGIVPAEDAALALVLRESAKDRSENVMIVDLLRNDLSRVCRDHSVKVPELCALESFATVHHLVSTVTGRLREGKTAVDLLRAAFPGGSITGAPKVRAMEVIAELESARRGPYCGSIGYIGFDGTMDTNIAIRTIAFTNNTAVFQVGGGIVADSDPDQEYEETLAKAKALFFCFKASQSDRTG